MSCASYFRMLYVLSKIYRIIFQVSWTRYWYESIHF